MFDNIAATPRVEEIKPHVLEASGPSSDVTPPPTDQIFSLYEQVNQIPYTAEHFGMTKSQFLSLKAADIDNIIPMMQEIESKVREQMSMNRYTDSTETYKQIINDIQDVLKIKDYETTQSKIEKIFLYLTEGKVALKRFQMKRNTMADNIDHAKNQAMKELRKVYPNKLRSLGGYDIFMKR